MVRKGTSTMNVTNEGSTAETSCGVNSDGDCGMCNCDGKCSREQSEKCYRETLLRLDGSRELARQAMHLEEHKMHEWRAEARRLCYVVLGDPRRELPRSQLQQLLANWPTARTEVEHNPHIATAVPLGAWNRGGRFFQKHVEPVDTFLWPSRPQDA